MTTASPLLAAALRPDIAVQPCGTGIWTTLAPEEQPSSYDPIAAAYDKVIGNPIYNRLVWGVWSSAYADAARAMLARVPDDVLLDCGCGSLVFTGRAYGDDAGRLVLFDRSLGMLRRAARRLPAATLCQGDLLAPPFVAGGFAGVMCWGVLHLFGADGPVLDLLARLVRPGGVVALSSLVLAGRWPGDRMLHLLHRKGEAAVPQSASAVTEAFAARFTIEQHDLRGNMLMLRGRRAD